MAAVVEVVAADAVVGPGPLPLPSLGARSLAPTHPHSHPPHTPNHPPLDPSDAQINVVARLLGPPRPGEEAAASKAWSTPPAASPSGGAWMGALGSPPRNPFTGPTTLGPTSPSMGPTSPSMGPIYKAQLREGGAFGGARQSMEAVPEQGAVRVAVSRALAGGAPLLEAGAGGGPVRWVRWVCVA